MKAFLASGVRKSAPEELIFEKLAFGKSDFMDLVNFVTVDRFSILLPLSAPPAVLNTSWFSALVLRFSSLVDLLVI